MRMRLSANTILLARLSQDVVLLPPPIPKHVTLSSVLWHHHFRVHGRSEYILPTPSHILSCIQNIPWVPILMCQWPARVLICHYYCSFGAKNENSRNEGTLWRDLKFRRQRGKRSESGFLLASSDELPIRFPSPTFQMVSVFCVCCNRDINSPENSYHWGKDPCMTGLDSTASLHGINNIFCFLNWIPAVHWSYPLNY